MAITANVPAEQMEPARCTGCAGTKNAPIAGVFSIDSHAPMSTPVKLVLCQECGRDAANAIGFMCIRDGSWSKLEPRKRKTKTT